MDWSEYPSRVSDGDNRAEVYYTFLHTEERITEEEDEEEARALLKKTLCCEIRRRTREYEKRIIRRTNKFCEERVHDGLSRSLLNRGRLFTQHVFAQLKA